MPHNPFSITFLKQIQAGPHLDAPALFFRYSGGRVLMDKNIGTGKTLTQRLLQTVRNLMCSNQRQRIIHFQMQLNKTGRP